MRDYTRHDEALTWLAPYGPDLAWGFTNHHPMVVEALASLGRGEAALPWLEAHAEGLVERPAPHEPIGDDWQEALGVPARFADWEAHFARALEEVPWQEVVARWAPALLPGLAGAATHGVIRAAHAARALSEADTALRRAELAAGLGYWAATWQTLPSAVFEGSARPVARSAREALAEVPMIRELRPEAASIVAALAALDEHPAFAPVIALFDVERDPAQAVSDLTATFARVLLASSEDRIDAIVFTHGVTSAETLRTLLPLLGEAGQRLALAHAWQAGAALHAAYGRALPGDAPPAAAPDPRELVEQAIACGDDHAIKLTAACLGEYGREGDPVYLAAARRGIERLGGA